MAHLNISLGISKFDDLSSLKMRDKDFSNLQKDGGQRSNKPSRHQLDTNSMEHMWHLGGCDFSVKRNP